MSTFGSHFRVTTYGESHCASVGCIVDGVPPGMALSDADVQVQLSRRRPGQSNLTTPRDEKDKVQIQSGVEKGVTLGTPIAMRVQNQDQRPNDYTDRTLDLYPRPSHADYTYLEKYGVKASSGGGRSSARETIGRVAAGAVAEKYLAEAYGVEIVAFVSSVGKIHIPRFPDESLQIGQAAQGADPLGDDGEAPLSEEFRKLLGSVTRRVVDQNTIRCPHLEAAKKMEERIIAAKEAHDSIGGTVTCVIRGVPLGIGEPCFDKLEAKLAHAMMSIPATKAFEIGSGFRGTEVPGSKHNDAFVRKPNGKLGTLTNWSGGIQGGISNGEDIYFRIGFKSPATISQEQRTATYGGDDGILTTRGRHDPCVVPRAVPIVEAMAALVIIDAVLAQEGRVAAAARLPQEPVRALPPSMRRANDPEAEAEKAAKQAGEKVIDA
ncbi:bifunctional chorismate synthase/riboflavin reductase [NAD(P)H] aro2 [Tilletia horrida]|uniref:Chorismate synthase n=1 Tax=Tilletia horrida TaxID=155126 RepID=A0AAN6GRJ1_9BASI|nr:bifunctional chorismate synthase/riboflavin reductase [NAD(P)H] aro2 [Tilletia horrida]KAK0547359.1 bifunctional chorismate synthase/riboflavin reductase [NAD(P)H] aro2 [Tilletia horrida]KAK0562788.1 bifunctional chorismate synthase/riboflavin reductase [NAD(P)H] aro2 [Tilletia horrida]